MFKVLLRAGRQGANINVERVITIREANAGYKGGGVCGVRAAGLKVYSPKTGLQVGLQLS